MSESSWEYNRKRALRRDGGQCQDCGAAGQRAHVHHITPRSDGGGDGLENLVTLCPQCHAERHDGRVCRTCGGVLHDYSGQRPVYDKKGATLVDVCQSCFNQIRESESETTCALCVSGDATETRYNAGLAARDAPHEMHGICDRCRKILVFEPHWKSLDYFSMVGSVDFRHWEANDE